MDQTTRHRELVTLYGAKMVERAVRHVRKRVSEAEKVFKDWAKFNDTVVEAEKKLARPNLSDKAREKAENTVSKYADLRIRAMMKFYRWVDTLLQNETQRRAELRVAADLEAERLRAEFGGEKEEGEEEDEEEEEAKETSDSSSDDEEDDEDEEKSEEDREESEERPKSPAGSFHGFSPAASQPNLEETLRESPDEEQEEEQVEEQVEPEAPKVREVSPIGDDELFHKEKVSSVRVRVSSHCAKMDLSSF